MTIAFIHNNQAFLPAIEVYRSFFARFSGVETEVHCLQGRSGRNTEVEWYFMGSHLKRQPGTVVVHEYASASVPPFARIKNLIKKNINCLPDYRIFHNEYVRKQFSFQDNIPNGLRGHGIVQHHAASNSNAAKRYDFIYSGTLDSKRGLDALFQCFTKGALQHRTLLVLSRNYSNLAEQFSPFKNICFKGPVPHPEVHHYIAQCRFAINYMPDKPPFNEQVSAKFLDYVACRVPVITSAYKWINGFEKQYGGQYFYLEKDLSNFTWNNITSFQYAFPRLDEWTWQQQMKKSGIITFLQQRFPDIQWSLPPEDEG